MGNVVTVRYAGDTVSPKHHRGYPPADIAAKRETNSTKLFISMITMAEIEDGIAKIRRQTDTLKSKVLSFRMETLVHFYAAHILHFGLAIAGDADALSDHAYRQGHAPVLAGIITAATAQHHKLTILTTLKGNFTF